MDFNKIIQIPQFKALTVDLAEEGCVIIHGELQDTDKTCPECGKEALKPHQYYEKRVRHLPILEKPTYLAFERKDWICQCGKVFLERLAFQDLKSRCTKDYEQYIYRKVTKQDISSVAEEEGVSWDKVEGIFLKGGHAKRGTTDRQRGGQGHTVACG